MKKRILTFVFWTVAASGLAFAAPLQPENEFEQLMEKIRKEFARTPDATELAVAMERYKEADGSFADVDYASIQRTQWPPLLHIDRLYDWAFAYTTPGHPYYEDERLWGRLVRGLEYWYERNPWCHNWWYNQIAEPQRLGVMLIQLRTGKKQLPAELEQKTLERIRKEGGHPAKWTGANRTDIALHWIYRACLQQNEEDLETALENVYNPVVYTTKEGFQCDNSYFQHGRQLYIGGYGDEILKGITQVALYTKGTRFAIPPEKLALLSKFMRETYYATLRGPYMLFDVLGRGVSRPGVTDKSHTALFARRMVQLDEAHADEFRAIIARLEGRESPSYALAPKHTHYYRADYTLHVRPHYTFDVRMVSTRTARCEYGNGENLKTYFLSDGCTSITTRGDEYFDIFPVWHWTRIPGTTAPQLDPVPLAPSDWQTPGTSTFAGGVSDSLYGVSAYAYCDTLAGVHTEARKAWFFFDDEVVCLGAGIRSGAEAELSTTVNQCLLAPDRQVWVSSGRDVRAQEEAVARYRSPRWVLHDEVAYLFPEGGELSVSKATRSGTWYDINRTAPKDTVRQEVFTLHFDHGLKPADATYAYLVVPGLRTVAEVQAYSRRCPVSILSNTPERQVVRHKELGLWGMVFYTAGTFRRKGVEVTVSHPCTLLLKEDGTLHVADPAQRQEEIEVTLRLPAWGKKRVTLHADFRGSGIRAGATKLYRPGR